MVGVDGCRSGWVAVRSTARRAYEIEVLGSVQALWEWAAPHGRILIDIPIGLREGETAPRGCDAAARRLLRAPRAASVFAPPARPCLSLGDWAEASARNAQLTGRRLSRQAWNIAPKIREVDDFLREDPGRQARLREVHPELLFMALNGGMPMREAKRRPSGLQERLAVLERHVPGVAGVFEAGRGRVRRHGAAADDLLDALAAVVSARACGGDFATLPQTPETDACGLRMEILYPRRALGPASEVAASACLR